MAAIIGRLNSPVKENGERDVIYFETSIDAVIDYTTGQTVREIIEEHTYPDASLTEPGLMSPEDKSHLDELYNQLIIVRATDPKRACLWMQVHRQTTEESGDVEVRTPMAMYIYTYNSSTDTYIRTSDLDAYIRNCHESLGRYEFELRKITVAGDTKCISEFGTTYVPTVKYGVDNTCTIPYTVVNDTTIFGKPAMHVAIVVQSVTTDLISSYIPYDVYIMLLPDGTPAPETVDPENPGDDTGTDGGDGDNNNESETNNAGT